MYKLEHMHFNAPGDEATISPNRQIDSVERTKSRRLAMDPWIKFLFRLLMLMCVCHGMKEIDKLSEPVEIALAALAPDNSCVRTVVRSTIVDCRNAISSNDRIIIAIKLSVCEFEAAVVDYPRVCAFESRWAECTTQLETRAQWWTTFSGNYRAIGQICLEHQRDLVVEDFVELHRDLSRVQLSLASDLHHLVIGLDVRDSHLDAVLDKYYELSTGIDKIASILADMLSSMEVSIESIHNELAKTTFLHQEVRNNVNEDIRLLGNLAMAQFENLNSVVNQSLSHLGDKLNSITSADNAVNQMLQSQIHAQKYMVDTSFLAHHIQKVVQDSADRIVELAETHDKIIRTVDKAASSIEMIGSEFCYLYSQGVVDMVLRSKWKVVIFAISYMYTRRRFAAFLAIAFFFAPTVAYLAMNAAIWCANYYVTIKSRSDCPRYRSVEMLF